MIICFGAVKRQLQKKVESITQSHETTPEMEEILQQIFFFLPIIRM
jgi:hypothetical protein